MTEFLVIISVVTVCYSRKLPYLLVGWLWFLGMLVPVIGLVQVGEQAWADRYAYLPSVAPFVLLASTFIYLFSKWRPALIFLSIGWAALLGYGTFRQVSVWKDSIALWENVLRVYPKNNVIVYTNLAASYEEAGHWNDALAEYNQAIATQVPLANPHHGKGKILLEKGLTDEAIQEFKTSISIDPTYTEPHSDLGMVYERAGLHAEALAEIHKAIRLDPEYAPAYNNLGMVLKSQGKLEESIGAFRKAQSLDPDNGTYLRNLISIYQQMGNHKETLALYRELSNL